MKTNIKFTNMDRDVALKDYAQSKVEAFSKLLRDKDEQNAVCNIELKTSTRHQTGDVCYAEVTLSVGGNVYRSSKEEPTLTKAIDKVKDDILRELRIAKRTERHNLLRGAAKVKSMIQKANG